MKLFHNAIYIYIWKSLHVRLNDRYTNIHISIANLNDTSF